MMTKKAFVLSALVAAMIGLVGLASCSSQPSPQGWQPPKPVRVECTAKGEARDSSSWATLFPSYMTWVSVASRDKAGGMLLRDGDVLFNPPMVYYASDGATLRLAIEPSRILLAGKTVCIPLGDGAAGWEWIDKASPQDPMPLLMQLSLNWEWIDKASPQELAGLRLVVIVGEINAARLPLLKKLAKANPGVAIQAGKYEDLAQVLPLFKPRILLLGDMGIPADGRKLFADQKQIETLLISAKEKGSLDFLADLPALRRLAIGDWDVEKAGPLPKGLAALRSLLVFGWKQKDISALADAPAGLEELSVLMSDSLTDISGVAKWAGLKTLILNLDGELADVSPIAALKELRWLGLPRKITKEQFAAVVKEHPGLVALELIKCEGAEDLSPLRDLKGLQSLVLMGPNKGLDVLRDVKSLRFVAYVDPAAKDSLDGVDAIQKMLPDAMVVPAAPVCLGSGWLLAIFPAAAIAWLIAARPWRRMRAAPQHA